MEEEYELPTRTWDCQSCGHLVERWRGQGDVDCANCGACYNSFGQRLRDDWRGNSSWQYDDVDDMEGFERQQLSYEDY
jgi:predicted ATP-dependent serine protease